MTTPYPPRRCNTCREIIKVNRESGEPIWEHVNETSEVHEITPMKIKDYTEDEKKA